MSRTGRVAAKLATGATTGITVVALCASPAAAYWSGGGTGAGEATTAQLVAPTVTATAAAYATDVAVGWSSGSAPAGLVRLGYYVQRTAAGITSAACGSSAAALLPDSSTDCVDSTVPDGIYTYSVTAVYHGWTATGSASSPVTVAADHTVPTVSLAGADASSALLAQRSGSYRLFFRPTTSGSITINATVTDGETGPAYATFPSAGATGWSHTSETVTGGSGVAPAITYTSAPYAYAASAAVPATMTVTGTDVAHNIGSTSVTFQSDTTAPAGGGVTVNGVASTGAGSVSTSTSGAFAVAAITPYAEAASTTESGLAASELTRQAAPLAASICGSFGAATVVSGSAPVAQSLADGCYRYTLTGTDNVGNVATTTTTVKVDTTAPDGGALTVNAVDATGGGSTSTNRTGAFALARTDFTDSQSGIGSSTLVRTTATLTAGVCGSFASATTISGAPAQSSLATNCYRYVLTGTNTFGGASALTSTVLVDTVAPTGGALNVNSVAATSGGSSSTNTTGAVTIGTMTAFTDANSGISGTVLTRVRAPVANATCGAFDSSTTVTIASTGTDSGLSSGCYRYTLTGTDNAGNTAILSTTVRVDTTAPTGGALSANGVDASTVGTTSYTPTALWALTRTDFTDAESGMTSSTLVRTQATYSAGACASFGTPSTITGTPDQSGLATRCYRYILTGTNPLGLVSTLQTTVLLDTTAPTGGALTVNSVAASAAGTTSNNGTGAYSITVATGLTDSNSGMASNVITRTEAPLSGGSCGTFDSATTTTVTGTIPITQSGLDTACYRYTLTGTNGVGGTAALTTTVRVDTSAPTGGALTVNGVAADVTATTSTATVGSWAIGRANFTDPDSTMTVQTLVRSSASLTNGTCGTFSGSTTITGTSESGLATNCYRYVLTGTNSSGLTSTLTTIVKVDTAAPTGGAVTVNAGAASGTGTSTTSTSGTFNVSALTNYTDTTSGMATNTLVRTAAPVSAGVCGTFDPTTATTISGTPPIPQTTLPSGCYRYTLTGTNNFGGAAAIFTTVRVDTTAPSGGALAMNGVDATSAGSTSTNSTGTWTLSRTDFADPETAMTVQTLVRTSATITNGTCGTFGSSTTITGTAESGLATNCYKYVLTGTNSLGLTSTVTTTVKVDTTAPTGGALTVNGTAATVGGSSSTSASGSFTVSVMTAMADGNSGMAGTTLTRTTAPLSAGVCGVFDSSTATVVTGTLPIAQSGLTAGCYQYVLTGTNNVGAASSLTTTVRVGS